MAKILFLILMIVISGDNSQFTVLIDPGHGGKDPGVKWTDSLMEKDISFQYAQRLAKELKKLNIHFAFTHESVDSFIPIHNRLKMITDSQASVLISVHVNPASSDSNAIELFYNPADTGSIVLSQFLKTELENQNLSVILSPAKFAIVKYASVPAVMVNLRTGKSEKGVQNLLNKIRKEKICLGLANGLKKFKIKLLKK